MWIFVINMNVLQRFISERKKNSGIEFWYNTHRQIYGCDKIGKSVNMGPQIWDILHN